MVVLLAGHPIAAEELWNRLFPVQGPSCLVTEVGWSGSSTSQCFQICLCAGTQPFMEITYSPLPYTFIVFKKILKTHAALFEVNSTYTASLTHCFRWIFSLYIKWNYRVVTHFLRLTSSGGTDELRAPQTEVLRDGWIVYCSFHGLYWH